MSESRTRCPAGAPAGARPGGPAPVPPSHHGYAAERWPLLTWLELGPLPSAVPCARGHTQLVLREWEFAGLCQDACLIVSELVSNAIAATQYLPPPSPPVWLWLVSDATWLLIVAGDASRQPPLRMDTGLESGSGRGLLLVEAFSTRWGWYPTEGEQICKVVWAELRPSARL